MHHASTKKCCITLCVICLVVHVLPFCHANLIGSKVLSVGEELWKETLPLQMGSRIYQLQGLKSHAWYEVKISYPAFIPAGFSIQLKRGNSELGLKQQRKLLNTEKLIFKSDELDLLSDQVGMFVLVTVEPEGVVAIPHVQERGDIIFNIGIPQKVWWVVVLVIVCLGLAFMIPSFLPAYLLQANQSPQLPNEIVSKDS